MTGDIAMITKGIIRKTCKELDIEIIEIAINPDQVHIFFKYPPQVFAELHCKETKRTDEQSSKKEFPHIKEFCDAPLWAPSCYHG